MSEETGGLAGGHPKFDQRFIDRYRTVCSAPFVRAERRVIGGEYGASGYTTMAQADRLGLELDLGPGRWLLDIGSGPGWPGAYLAKSTGCSVVLTDPTLEGVSLAANRLDSDRLSGHAIVTQGDMLPFRDGGFDAVTSGDVFC
ncbi:MAG: methyltransferase domain-containing protein [Acidimicrobiia bacterium]